MDIYKKYTFRLLYGIVICAISYAILHVSMFYFVLGTPEEKERYLDEWWQIKENYVSKIDRPKIVFVSGSNTLFGVDTSMVEHELDIPTVNMGVHAALNRYILERTKKSLKTGDIVIMPLEYDFYYDKCFGGEYASYIMMYDAYYFRKQDLEYKLKFIASVSPSELIEYAIRKIKPATEHESGYSSKYLNSNGDMTNNKYEKKDDKVLIAKTRGCPFKVMNEVPTAEAQLELKDFIGYCKENGIRVYATWPSYLSTAQRFTNEEIVVIKKIEKFYNDNGVDLLGEYSDFLYQPNDMYDTGYHMNDRGKAKRTNQLIELIKSKVL